MSGHVMSLTDTRDMVCVTRACLRSDAPRPP